MQRQLNAGDPPGDLAVSAEDFESLKLQIRQAHEPILDKANAEITVNDARECSQLLNQAFLTFCGMKEELLGGPFHAWLIELANPSKSQLHEWQGKALGYLRQTVVSLTGQTTAFALSLLFGMFVLVIALYYFLVDGPKMIRAAMRLSPLDDKYEAELFAEFANVSRAVVLATLLSAGGQAILAGIGYAVVGAGPLFLLTVVTGLMAMVPFVGAAAVWLPVALWVAFVDQAPGAAEAGRLIPGIGLAIYGAVVVSMADNVIKPWVLHGQSNLHPLLALLSVLGGVKTLGPIGLLVGPMVVSFLQALLNMLNTELRKDSGEAT
jgi:predicted PurR-regulated permease PerM